MKTLFHASVAVAFCAGVTACAVSGPTSVTTARAAPKIGSPYNARDAIAIGKSTKADLIAVLGQATVISFDSGFEVWVYQIAGDKPGLGELVGRAGSERGTPGKTEFVVLFAPSGVVTKTRIRPAPPTSEAKGT